MLFKFTNGLLKLQNYFVNLAFGAVMMAIARETRIKLFYSFYYLLFPISFVAGPFLSDNTDESVYL